jgi:hypothetical protein
MVPDPIEPRRAKFPRWLGVLPGLLLVTIFSVRAFVQMGQATRVVSGNATSNPSKSLACVEVYSVSLSNSEFYVPEGQEFSPRKAPELSTVLSGMVRNDCGEPLKSATIHIQVRDAAGKRGQGSVTITELNLGQAKPFSKAWMGRVTSYEIGKIE